MSGVHYGHYKAAIQCDISTKIVAQQLTVVARSGIPPESWSIRLQVMLDKIARVCLVKKLRAIQLYKACFNCYNQFVFRKAAMDSLNSISYTPKELFSQKGSAEILRNPYSKKSPLPSVDTSPHLAISPNDTSYQILGQARIQQRHTTCHNHLPGILAQ